MSIEKFISQPPLIVHSSLSQLRYLVLSEGLSDEDHQRTRSHVWSILSRASLEKCTQEYLRLVQLGAPPSNWISKIKNDTFRTLSTDEKFRNKVTESQLIRVLSCFAWDVLDNNQTHELPGLSPYVQGMNVLLAPFLYVCPTEPIAYKLFHSLCFQMIPTYLNQSLSGVHVAAKLLDKCLKIIDPKLSKFLTDNLLTAEIFGIPSILTLSACNKPLDQVIKLWDFMFAYGFHMNILFIVAQLVINRQAIMVSSSPMNLLRETPSINADEIITLGVGFLAKLPDTLYTKLVDHLTDESITMSNHL
ncbi:Bub2 [Kluyveromyces lactis]|nr:Bub2 [Kluyveromyces lactis]